jgi:dipeptidyl aminopeptidase/acylaminoacyl peptidase
MRDLVLICLTSLAVPGFSQGEHPFTSEEMMKLKRVDGPEVSPAGKRVIFSVVDVDLDANKKMSHIWIGPTSGGQEREIISSQDADRPRWTRRFALLSNKGGGSQVWIADFEGREGIMSGVHELTSSLIFPTRPNIRRSRRIPNSGTKP